jgi:hypothetical protein
MKEGIMNRRQKIEARLMKKVDGYRRPSDLVYVIVRAEKFGFKQLAYRARKMLSKCE